MNTAVWYKPPDVAAQLRAARLDPGRRHALRARYRDYATTPLTSGEWAAQELERPSNRLHHRTVTVAGKPYHWRQSYDGVLRLAPGASPW